MKERRQWVPTGSCRSWRTAWGNIVLSEALYQNEIGPGPLVDTAIMSQAAISSHYFSARTDLLPSIYVPGHGSVWTDHTVAHSNPTWTEYLGFGTSGTIGGLTPRFTNISKSGNIEILNYYNPDDYALTSWRMDQACKPTTSRGLAYLLSAYSQVDFGNVSLSGGGFLEYLRFLFGGDDPQGFGHTRYVYDDGDNAFYRETIHYSILDDVWVVDSRVALNLSANEYEMFAFGASSMVAALGNVDWHNIPRVFSDGANLKTLAPVFNNQNTGHSAQFIGSYIGTKAYWQGLVGDIQ